MRAEENQRERDRWIRKWEEEKEEAKRLIKESLQCLCNVMKDVLGDRVQNVVVSGCFEYSSPCSSSCLLKDSGMGGKTLEINPHDHVIKDLKKRSDADKNDFHVRNATLLLFNYAELHYKTMREQQTAKV
ncbi:heat shock protein 90-3-like [Papaver somniferum]|uniref:heat shock protein 90-3-like n=1 Tax=Papaver somniferum TaxID=3469 RepID=UPI000E6FC645|nr:heat shock protein 90-3-like [Papaver somniferum]